MKAKLLVLSVALALVGNVLAQSNRQEQLDKLKQQSEERCASPEFKAYYDKTPCFANQINFQYVSDTSKITPAQKKTFLKVRSEIDASQRERNRIDRETGFAWAVDVVEQYLIPPNDANNLDLMNGKITWGEYNTKRRDIFNNFMAEVRKTASKQPAF
jgi:antitoxin component HigA of HigAB toxin-antitoxin module